jgi:hypothetical protein
MYISSNYSIKDIQGNIQDGMAFISEDFLSEVIDDLQIIAKNLRGDNRAKLQHIIEKLDDIAQCTMNSVDYSNGQLKQALKSIKGD